MENYLENMEKIASLREKFYQLFYRHNSIDPNLNFSYDYKHNLYIDDENGLVAILKFGGCGTIPLIKTNRKFHPLNKDLISSGFYPIK